MLDGLGKTQGRRGIALVKTAEQANHNTRKTRIIRRLDGRDNRRTLNLKERRGCGLVSVYAGLREDQATVEELGVLVKLQLAIVAARQLGHAALVKVQNPSL